MISRRAALQLGAVAGCVAVGGLAAQQAGVLDDALRAVGLSPHAEPDPRDVALLREAAQGQADLLATLDAVDLEGTAVADLRAVLSEQLAAVSDGPLPSASSGAVPPGGLDFIVFAERAEAAAAARADGAMSAGSLAVIKVLAAMSAGLEQVAVAARRLA